MTFMNPRSAEASPTRPWPAERIEHWPIERLIPYTNNPRLHSEADVDKIAASIRQWGWTNPALVDENGTLIAGHGRVAAAVRSPGRVVSDPVGWIGDHQVRLRSGQHQRDISCVGAITAANQVASHLPYIAEPSYWLIGYFRDAVGIAQTTRPQTPEDLVKAIRLKADQIEIETAEFEITQLTAQQIGVPTPTRGQFIVS